MESPVTFNSQLTLFELEMDRVPEVIEIWKTESIQPATAEELDVINCCLEHPETCEACN